MPRPLFLCLAIVAAFQIHLAAAAPADDLPIAPRVEELAGRLGIDPTRDPARFMADMARLLYATSDNRPPELIAQRPTPAIDGSPAAHVPVPLPAAVWSAAVFRHAVPPEQLITAILSDRRASLLCRGLAGLDDETLTYFAERPTLVKFLYEQAAGTFAAFGGNLRIHNGRVVAPGGNDAAVLWEFAVGESLATPERFVRVLYGEGDGRLAYLYNTIAMSTPSAAAFALGLWIPDATQRAKRFQALADACFDVYREWHPEQHPFARPLGDLTLFLFRINVDATGRPTPPNSRAFWARALDVAESTSGSDEAPLVGGADGPIDAAWLIAATGNLDMYSRTDRLDVFAFGQRVFSDSADGNSAAAEVLREFRDYRMLMLTVERIGVRSPSVYLALQRRAADVVSGGIQHRFWSLAQFQGSIALIARMRRAGTISTPDASVLLASLGAVPFRNDQYDGGVASWIRSELARKLPREGTWEARLISALAGPADESAAPRLFWEGQEYRVDLPYAERQRLQIVRGKQGGHTIDLAMAIDGLARTLLSQTLTVEAAQEAARRARAVAAESAQRLKHPVVNLLPPSVELSRDALEWLTESAEEISRITRPNDVRKGARLGSSLHQLADLILGNALVSLAYAMDIGDPDGAALLAGNVSLRHDFGLARRDPGGRLRIPWSVPRQDFQPGVPWHVTGSLLGLDIALAPMNLHRLSTDRIVEAPKLSSIDREAFAVGVTLMESGRLKDADVDTIAAAIERGRQRVKALAAGSESLETISDFLGLDGWRRRVIAWALRTQPQSLEQEFSLVEFLTLGRPGAADLDAWGTVALQTDGCACTRLPGTRAWPIFEGRAQLPVVAATMGDFNLALALVLREMRLPATLARPILSVAMQDFLDDMDPAHTSDWWALVRKARTIRRQQVEDYVAVAAAVNGPLVPIESDISPGH